MSVDLGRITLNPPVFLAPMAGITDVPFPALAARFGAGLVASEMAASAEVVRGKPSAWAPAELGFDDGRTAVQLDGIAPGLRARILTLTDPAAVTAAIRGLADCEALDAAA